MPDDGDDVKFIIDDIKIDKSANERQRLQFHCTIHDDHSMAKAGCHATLCT